MERDEDLRTACFLALDALRAQFGDDLPYRGALDRGFRGRDAATLEDEDGPMLDLLKGFHDTEIFLPSERRRPDRDRLAVRFDEFHAAAAA